MKKLYLLILLSCLFAYGKVTHAEPNTLPAENKQTNSQRTDFLDNYIQEVDALHEATSQPDELLKQEPKILQLQEREKQILEQGKIEREKIEEKINKEKFEQKRAEEKRQHIKDTYEKAPLGLYWGISQEETKDIDFTLQPAERKNYAEVYLVESEHNLHPEFKHILVIYGKRDHLWCIYAQGTPKEDTPNATEVMHLYKKYYEALEKKYGNAQEYFTPYKYTEEIVEETEDPKKPKIIVIEKENPLGGPTFLQELREEKASLYATFENNEVGVVMSVNVNENNQSYLTIDFKNLKLMQAEKDAELTELVDEL